MEKGNKSPFAALLPQYQVEGFDVRNAMSKSSRVLDDGTVEESQYLKTNVLSAWFYTVFPKGAIVHKMGEVSPTRAAATVSVYRDVSDPLPAATASAMRYYGEDDEGKYYVENAVTAATRAALTKLGFSAPLEISDETLYNIPEETELKKPDDEKEEPKKRKYTRRKVKEEAAEKPAEPEIDVVIPEIKDDEAVEIDDTPVNDPPPAAPAPTPAPVEEKAKSNEQKAGVPEASGSMTFEESKKAVFPVGADKGKTVDDVAKAKSLNAIRCSYEFFKRKFPNSEIAKACEVYLAYTGG